MSQTKLCSDIILSLALSEWAYVHFLVFSIGFAVSVSISTR